MAEKVIELRYQHFGSHAEMCDGMSDETRELIEAARVAASRSISPYSLFRVGAAGRLSSGDIVLGANVESEVYPAGICAERNMLFNAAINYPNLSVVEVAIISLSSAEECYPCGLCRQTLLDTERRQGSPIRIVMAGESTATVVESASMLLPLSFELK